MQNAARRLASAIAATGFVLVVAPAAIAADTTVTAVDNEFQPATVTIDAGDTVTWVNNGNAPHDATGNGWRTELLLSGESGSVTFDEAGSYDYICSIHPEMTGTVVVAAAGGSGGGGGGGSDGGGGVPMPGTDTATAPAGMLTPLDLAPWFAGLAATLLVGRRRLARRGA